MAIYIRDKQGDLTALNIPAINGKSAYEVALSNGFEGTEKEWLKSLKGENGSEEIYIGTTEGAPSTASMVIDPEEDNEYDGFFTGSKYDYLGKEHSTLKAVNDSNIEHVLRRVNTQKYEGSSITANNTYAKQVNNVILKGATKFKDLDNGEFIDNYEEGKNLELVGSKSKEIKIRNSNFISLQSGDIVMGEIDGNGVSYSHVKYSVMLREDLYIEAPPNKYCWIYLTKTSRLTDNIMAYDKNKNFIATCNLYKPTPPNTKFIRFSHAVPYRVDQNPGIMEEIVSQCKGVFVDSYVPNPQYTDIPEHQSSFLLLPIDSALYSIGDNYDYIDLNTGTYVQNITIRPYQQGDESNNTVLTDKKNTVYKLEQSVVSKIDLQGQKIYSHDGTTYYICQSEPSYPSPILSMEVPTDLASLVQDERAINQKLYNDQNTIIDSQLSLYESMSNMLLKDNNEVVPEYIQDLYELAYERGIRIRKQEVDINENTR